MAHAYTPGLKVTRRTLIRKRRLLPLAGKVLVTPGERVRAEMPVAEAELPGQVHPVNVANLLGVRPEELPGNMLKREGDRVHRGEPIAQTRPWIKWLRAVCRAPADGTVESISDLTGQVMVREPPQKVTVEAYVDGTVVEVIPSEGAVVEAEAALVQGIFGVGGERRGRLKVIAQAPDTVVGSDEIGPACQDCIIVVGSRVTAPLVEAARRAGAVAIVAAAMPAADLRLVLGYDIGVAVTGSEQVGLTLVLTEGFGRLPMARRTYELLAEMEGRRASVCGATQIRAGVIRPEIIVSLDGSPTGRGEAGPRAHADGLREGDSVRVIREPHFGAIGQVEELIPGLVQIETESRVRALRVRTQDGRSLLVPRSNVEVMQA
mgnify:CR=1 FL=1